MVDVMQAVIEKVAEAGKVNIHIDPAVDRQNADGLWICGVCGTPKETVIDAPGGGTMTVRCLCDCQSEKLKAEKLAEAAKAREQMRSEWLAGYEQMTFANDNGKNPTMEFARRYVANWDDIKGSGYSCTMVGGVGCGKTYAAAAIANEIFTRGEKVWMVGAGNLVDSMGFDTEERTLNRLRIFDLIVIDDLGAERETGYATQKLFDAIDLRARSGLPTIFTTNINPDEPGADLAAERIASRVRGFAPVLKCKGGDLRGAAGKAKRAELMQLLTGEVNA